MKLNNNFVLMIFASVFFGTLDASPTKKIACIAEKSLSSWVKPNKLRMLNLVNNRFCQTADGDIKESKDEINILKEMTTTKLNKTQNPQTMSFTARNNEIEALSSKLDKKHCSQIPPVWAPRDTKIDFLTNLNRYLALIAANKK